MLSKSCEYAIKAMIYLAQQGDLQQKISYKEIASAIKAPQPFMAKVLQQLTQQGLLLSTKGPGGGFYLPKDYETYSVAKIVKAIDGESIFVSCILGLDKCSEKRPCALHNAYVPIKQQLIAMLELHTLNHFDCELLKKIIS